MPIPTRTFRAFFSSTFVDLKEVRNTPRGCRVGRSRNSRMSAKALAHRGRFRRLTSAGASRGCRTQ